MSHRIRQPLRNRILDGGLNVGDCEPFWAELTSLRALLWSAVATPKAVDGVTTYRSRRSRAGARRAVLGGDRVAGRARRQIHRCLVESPNVVLAGSEGRT